VYSREISDATRMHGKRVGQVDLPAATGLCLLLTSQVCQAWARVPVLPVTSLLAGEQEVVQGSPHHHFS